jgi:hypothetical protein
METGLYLVIAGLIFSLAMLVVEFVTIKKQWNEATDLFSFAGSVIKTHAMGMIGIAVGAALFIVGLIMLLI